MDELYKSLRKYADSDYLPMHMPGHKRRVGEMGNPYSVDITEIEGFDNLHQSEGLLLEAQKRAADLYGSEETHYLINGSTAGILSAVSGCTSFGGKILIGRNCHKSVYHAALLRGLDIRFLYPQFISSMGINGAILPEDVEKALKEDPDIQAVLITSPTYDGVVSKIAEIAEVVHRREIPLIVDEAHGAHFPFSKHFPEDSVSAGADVVIHSLHKTLPSLTQTALIHLNGPLIVREKIRSYLTVYQTSSPSYILMAAIDQCVAWVGAHAKEFQSFYEALQRLRGRLREMKRLKLLEVPGMDPSRILVSVRGTGLCGAELSALLRTEFHIELEMACSAYVCGITTVADTEESLSRMGDAFLAVDRRLSERPQTVETETADEILRAGTVCTLLEAEEREKEYVRIMDAGGRISGGFISVYPPGIPLLAPGERITGEILEQIGKYQKQLLNIQGIDGGRICVLKERSMDGQDILSDGQEFIGKRYNL